MARKFSEHDLCEGVVITEKQIQKAENAVSMWEAVRPIFEMDGWQIFINHVREIHDKLDKLSNCDTNFNRFIYQKGEVAGIKRFLDVPKALQKSATSASKILEVGLAEDKE